MDSVLLFGGQIKLSIDTDIEPGSIKALEKSSVDTSVDTSAAAIAGASDSASISTPAKVGNNGSWAAAGLPDLDISCLLEEFIAWLRTDKCRGFGEDREIVLKFPQLSLEISEDNIYCQDLQIQDIILVLSANDSKGPLEVNVKTRTRFITAYNKLVHVVAAQIDGDSVETAIGKASPIKDTAIKNDTAAPAADSEKVIDTTTDPTSDTAVDSATGAGKAAADATVPVESRRETANGTEVDNEKAMAESTAAGSGGNETTALAEPTLTAVADDTSTAVHQAGHQTDLKTSPDDAKDSLKHNVAEKEAVEGPATVAEPIAAEVPERTEPVNPEMSLDAAETGSTTEPVTDPAAGTATRPENAPSTGPTSVSLTDPVLKTTKVDDQDDAGSAGFREQDPSSDTMSSANEIKRFKSASIEGQQSKDTADMAIDEETPKIPAERPSGEASAVDATTKERLVGDATAKESHSGQADVESSGHELLPGDTTAVKRSFEEDADEPKLKKAKSLQDSKET